MKNKAQVAKVRVNNDMFQIAREYRRISQTELADKVRVTQANISKIEAGITKEITDSLLSDISEELRFPREFFLQGETVTNIGSSALYNRGRKKISVADMKWIEANINIFRWNVKALLGGLKTNNPKILPMFDIEEEGSTPESIARKLRAYWKVPTGPIKNITTIVENAGVIIIPFDFGTRHLDGTCMWLADGPPLIFINSNLPSDRYRWTICHELGHLVMHSEPRETQEDEADAFAAEFLMPHAEIKFEFRRKLNLQLFADLKSIWRVSMAALAHRALDLRQMSERQYRYYMMNIRKLGLPEPYQFQKEEPSAWSELIAYYCSELKYTKEDFIKLLLSPMDFIEKFPYKSRPKLVLVK